jgi:hypothetical protein
MARALLAGAALPWAVWAVLGAGCQKSERATVDASPANAAASVSSASPMASDASSPRAARWGDAVIAGAHLPCRAASVDGDVRAEDVAQPGAAHGKAGPDGGAGLAIAARDEIPLDAWLDLGASARIVAKDPRTTRETTFRGRGRVRPCVARREESWVLAGVFESVVGAGEAPGSEEWLVTPFAVLRYATASLRVAVSPKGASVSSASGVAFAWIADDAQARWIGDAGAGATGAHDGGVANTDGWERVAEGTLTIEPTAPLQALPAARAAVDRCTALADRSHELAQLLMAPRAGLPDASAAAEQVLSRRVARAACAVAALRVGGLPEAASRDALAAKLEAAVAAWTAVPTP